MDAENARRFAAALTEFCHTHGVMLWPAIMADEADEIRFHYEAEFVPHSHSIIIRRVLS
jgi:hypothetical protein